MLQEQNKDKELAFEVQIAELKSGFEKAISENIWLEEGLDTQNKLWKLWTEKMTHKDSNRSNKSSDRSDSKEDDTELLLVENDEVIECDDEDDDTELIY